MGSTDIVQAVLSSPTFDEQRMKTIIIRILWMVAFMFLWIVVGGLLIGLVIITGFAKQLGDHWADIVTAVITILFFIFAGLGLWLPLSGRLPGTREHE